MVAATQNDTGEQDRADRHHRDRPEPAHDQCPLALADVVAAGGGGRLRQVGAESGAAFDLEAELVVRVDEDREVQREQPDDDQGDASTPR